jgi:site-specific recombinase
MDFSKYNFTPIIGFIKQIRLISENDSEQFNKLLEEIIEKKSIDEYFKNEFTVFCYFTLDNAFFVNAFAEYGINSNRGFFPEIARRLKHKILPSNLPENEFSHFINFVFNKKDDYLWIEKINYLNWEAIINLIDAEKLSEHSQKLAEQIHNAIIILCHRLATIGIDPYLASKFPEIDDTNSPFFELNLQVSLFVKKHLNNKTLEIDFEELETIWQNINRAEDIFNSIQFKKDQLGTSLHSTYLLQRAQQHICRIIMLLNLFVTTQKSSKVLTISQLLVDLVKAEQTKNRVRKFIKENTNLLAYRIASHTSEKGGHYIGFSKKENFKLFKSAMGGGLVVVFLVYIKHFIHELHAPLFIEGLLYGLNYGLGFVFMHLAHLTLATKQPAMTAAFIAESIDQGNNSGKKPWMMFKQVIRSQFVSLIGNLVVVLPLCFLSAWAIDYYFHHSVFNFTESKAHMYSNHPMYSASLIYAAITGVFLSLSGIVIGYIDNKVVYSEIAQRIIKHPKLIDKYGFTKRQKIAAFVEKNLGGISGNLFLGICLGMAGNLGKFIGIPFDIRHVTISSGNFAIALGSDQSYKLELIIAVFLGVIYIGIINIASSFLISFIVACRSRNLSWKQSLKVLTGMSK